MKLKLVVASMSVLGLISCPVFAETANQTADPVKHKHHKAKTCHSCHHRMARHEERREMMANVPVQPAPVEYVPRMDTFQSTMDEMTQNVGRAKPVPDWFNRIMFSGGLNFDAHWGNRSMGYTGENYRRFSLNDAYLNTTAFVNDWTKAFASISFNNTSNSVATFGSGTTPLVTLLSERKPGAYSFAYANNRLDLEQGYVTFGNLDCTPFFVQLGKQFQDYGRYVIHPIQRTLTQVMTETLATSAKVGFITRMGFNGSVFAFESPLLRSNPVTGTQTFARTTWGAALGFDMPCEQFGWDVGISYLSNIASVNDIAAAISLYQSGALFATNGTYNHQVGGLAAYGDVNSGPFSLGARYTTALTNFNPLDQSTVFFNPTANGAKPWAGDLTAGYGFNTCNVNHGIYVGYQASGNAVNLFIPQSRWVLGYSVEPWRSTSFGLEVARDQDYSTGKGGTGKSSGTIGARAAVRFG